MKPLDPLHAPLDGTNLIEASAGTGKTHTITTLLVRLVVESGLGIHEILVVTFTEAATAELRDRIRKRLRAALDAFRAPGSTKDADLEALAKRTKDRALAIQRLTLALRDFDRAAISTIHAFCLRVLQEHAFESGARFDLELLTDQAPLLTEVAEDFWSLAMVPLADDLYALRGGFGLGTAQKLVNTLARHPELPLVQTVDPPDPEALRARFTRVFEEARKQWGSPTLPDLTKGDALTRVTYKPPSIAKWRAALDEFFARDVASFAVPPDASHFTTAAIVKGTKKNQTSPVHRFFDVCGELLSIAERIPADLVLRLKLQTVKHTRRELPAKKAAQHLQSYEDLLHGLGSALHGPNGETLAKLLRKRFRAALIDEFQDTDPVQYGIFRKVFHGHGSLLLVGDPKQSIYAFRGADIFSYFEASNDAGKGRFTLEENHRSDRTLVRAVNTIFKRPELPFVFDEIPFHEVKARHDDRASFPDKAALEILFVPRTKEKGTSTGDIKQELPGLVAQQIALLLASKATIHGRRVEPGDIAVLTRSNQQARDVQAQLRHFRIPTALESDASVFHSEEAVELEQLLRAILEPTRADLVKTALATRLVGCSAHDLLALEDDEKAWEHRSEQLQSWQSRWHESGFVRAFRSLLTDLNVEPRLLGLVDGERRLTNLLHLGELLHQAATRHRLGMTGLVRWLGLMRVDQSSLSQLGSEASELRLESDARAVKLLTIHKSKGLQYPIVYCPFLWSALFPQDKIALKFHDRSDGNRLKLDLVPSEQSLGWAEKEELAENQRLLYVALTRAKHRCAIVWGGIHLSESSSLAYTLHGTDRYKAMSDDELRADLERLAKSSRGAIVVRDLVPTTKAKDWVESTAEAKTLQARPYTRKVDTFWRLGSFSGLSASKDVLSPPELEGHDDDEVDDRTSLPPAPAGDAEPVVLHAFPRGTRAGLMLHELLEKLDFTKPEALAPLASQVLARSGYPVDALHATLVQGLGNVLDTPLDAFTLRAIPQHKRLDELEFVFPVASSGSFTTSTLARVFEDHPSPAVPRAYVKQLRKLRFVPLRGFLVGFVDLVFEHEGKFHVVDYKSNHLGPNPDDYRLPGMAHAMSHHDYYLQYHLYVVALHRYLGQRLRDYDYDLHMGSVYYLFLRGMSPAYGADHGVFRDRPPRALIEALSRALETPKEEAAHV